MMDRNILCWLVGKPSGRSRQKCTPDGPGKKVNKLKSEQEDHSTTVFPMRGESITAEKRIPVGPLIVFKEMLTIIPVQSLRDDVCNTDIVTKWFVDRNRLLLQLDNREYVLQRSYEDGNYFTTEIIFDETLGIGLHTYKTSWLVWNRKYDVSLRMQWHMRFKAADDYLKRTVRLITTTNSIQASRDTVEKDFPVKVKNLGVESFRQMLTEKSLCTFQKSQVVSKTEMKNQNGRKIKTHDMTNF